MVKLLLDILKYVKNDDYNELKFCALPNDLTCSMEDVGGADCLWEDLDQLVIVWEAGKIEDV